MWTYHWTQRPYSYTQVITVCAWTAPIGIINMCCTNSDCNVETNFRALMLIMLCQRQNLNLNTWCLFQGKANSWSYLKETSVQPHELESSFCKGGTSWTKKKCNGSHSNIMKISADPFIKIFPTYFLWQLHLDIKKQIPFNSDSYHRH